MNRLRAILLSLTLGACTVLHPPLAVAQVSNIDSQMATSSILNAGKRAAKVPSIKRVPSVGVIRLDFYAVVPFNSDLPDPAEYRILAKRNAAGVAKLQNALRANPVTRDAIAKRGIGISQIAGAQISTNGSLRLYIFSNW